MSAVSVLEFFKLEALGNDFVLVDARRRDPGIDAEAARRLAERRRGVGCDQVLVLRPGREPGDLAAVEIFNADGSPAEQCGNGMRAIALWLNGAGELAEAGRVSTPAGKVDLRIEPDGRISAGLTVPEFEEVTENQAQFPERACGAFRVRLGNPHLVLQWPAVPGETDLEEIDPALVKRMNVGLAHVESAGRIALRVLERGAGATPACGSGAAAAACALIRSGRVKSPVRVAQPGGELVVNWSSGTEAVRLTGPASLVFEGKIPWPIHPPL